MRTLVHETDLCVVGGGMAGVCTAISAARHGIKVVLMQDRPVLGGNASSEIRMWVCGAHGDNNRETGIVEEIQLENFYRNTGLKYTLWDSIVYEKVKSEKNITLLLNCSCNEAKMNGDEIESITGWQLTSETFHTVKAKIFADCSGDSILAPLTGAEYRMGREERAEFNESIAPVKGDDMTMGMSCLFQIRETTSPKKFIKPEWAYTYPTDDDLPYRGHDRTTNWWWIEIGGLQDTIHDAEELRDELLKIAFGVWDHCKNQGDHGYENWEMEWIGFLPGKRESRRYVGDYIINQNDVESGGKFDDIIAYGGWSMDDHFPEGFYYHEGHPTIYHPAPSPWGICYRSIYSKNIKNLAFAGRNISVTHTAMSSSRVMATCSIIGQALGTAASLAVKCDQTMREVDVKLLQKLLMEDDCYIPYNSRRVSDLTLKARGNCEVVRNGIERGDDNLWIGNAGEYIEYTFDGSEDVGCVKIVFDSFLSRKYHNMPCYYPIVQEQFQLPDTIIKKFKLEYILGNGEKEEIVIEDNRQRFIKIPFGKKISSIRLVPLETWGCDEYRVFSFELTK
ncbi:MAG: FAD-dependent oxidoreductase [Eubacteriales bacterium]|nr:FAD-dependent oxidoreductase [Eubacteriales bacterium]